MRPIAEKRVLAMFAGAPCNFLHYVDSDFPGVKFATLVATVAEGITILQFHDDQLLARYIGNDHETHYTLRLTIRKGIFEVTLQLGFIVNQNGKRVAFTQYFMNSHF